MPDQPSRRRPAPPLVLSTPRQVLDEAVCEKRSVIILAILYSLCSHFLLSAAPQLGWTQNLADSPLTVEHVPGNERMLSWIKQPALIPS